MAVAQRYFDDLKVGDVFHSFARTLTKTRLSFAWTYDPQPFHISAKDGAVDVWPVASGLQTLAIASRLGSRRPVSGPMWPAMSYDLTWKKLIFAGDNLPCGPR